MNNLNVDEIILQNDRRGISLLKSYLPVNFCRKAALSVLNNSGTVFIVTGFFITNANSPETDGPPGAISIALALTYLGYKTYFITDRFSLSLMRKLSGNSSNTIIFPLTGESESQKFSLELIAKFNPSLIISVERCGRNSEGSYLNINGIDISEFTAKIDFLFHNHIMTIGIGDGGNEIGMGNYAEIISRSEGLPKKPCITRTTHSIISSVSNWGAYGLIAELSVLIKHNLLITLEEEKDIVKKAVKYGAVDGITKKHTPKVDGFNLLENSKTLYDLHQFVNNNI